MAAHPTIHFARRARRDIAEIYAWIAADASKERAEIITSRIDAAISQVALFPFLGRAHSDFPGDPRSHQIRPWQIIYQPLPTGKGITVIRVLDSRRDVANVLETGATA